MSRELCVLDPHARQLINADLYRDGQLPDLKAYVRRFARPVEIDALIHVIGEAMRIHSDDHRKSDAWLAPRLHAALRLQRYEAADRDMWTYLTVMVTEVREYVLWRWGMPIPPERVIGRTDRNALSRLWWLAELTRNGEDYGPTVEGLKLQDTALQLQDLNAFHNRAAALAYIRFLRDLNDGKPAVGIQAQQYAKALNHVLRTIVLDALAPDPGPDADVVQEWILATPDWTLLIRDELPEGPPEPDVPEHAVQEVITVLDDIKVSWFLGIS